MLYTDLTKKALKLCFEAHKDQKDKSGLPYVFHPFHLAEQMTDEATVVVALLHDIVEDTPYTLDDLRNMGFPQEVTNALALMTHDKRVPYMEYVAKIRENPIARAVKLADLEHNSDLSRLDELTTADWARVMKYMQAIELLEGRKEIGKLSRPAWRLACCGTVVSAGRRFCPSCGAPIHTPQEELMADFDMDATVWVCTCGNDEEMRFHYCSCCGKRRW